MNKFNIRVHSRQPNNNKKEIRSCLRAFTEQDLLNIC